MALYYLFHEVVTGAPSENLFYASTMLVRKSFEDLVAVIVRSFLVL